MAAQVARHVDGVLLQGLQRNDVEGPFVGGRQHDRRRHAVVVST